MPKHWCTAREIAVKVEGRTDETEIRRRVQLLSVAVVRGQIPGWAWRKRGRVYEYNPNYFLAPGPPLMEVRPGRLLMRGR